LAFASESNVLETCLAMTSLISWVGVDARGPASLYIASDSRISWDFDTWDVGRKVYACATRPDIFGYCGDVLFPALALGQVVALGDTRVALDELDAESRHRAVLAILQRSLAGVPMARRNAFSILHGSRDGEGMASVFHAWRIEWTSSTGWTDTELTIPSSSALLVAMGSGAGTVRNHDFAWTRSDVGGTSRAVFSAFCDALASRKDPLTGGAPRLVGLYRKSNGLPFGTIYRREASAFGVPLLAGSSLNTIEWRNEFFERCDGASLVRLDDAQPQPRPAGL
jgi:hypothetical protein